MRIAFLTAHFVTERLYDGGLANYIYRVSLALKSFGHEPEVFVCSDSNGELIKDGIKVYRVKTNSLLKPVVNVVTFGFFDTSLKVLIRSWLLNKKLKKIHAKDPFDIVQYPHLYALSLFSPEHIHSVIRFSGYTPLLIKSLKEINLFQLQQQSFWEDMAIGQLKDAFSPSQLVANYVSERCNKSVPVIESPIFIETKELDYSVYEQQVKSKKYFLFFGSISEIKGIGVIADSIHRILEKYPEYSFVFVGRESHKYSKKYTMKEVYEQAKPYDNRVIYINQLPHSQLYPIMKNAHLVVLPSVVDNLPNACLEAMAHECIVIGTFKTSFEDVVTDGENGFLCQPNNSDDLIKIIDRAMHIDEDKRQVIKNNAHLKSLELRPDITVRKLLDYYVAIIKRHNK